MLEGGRGSIVNISSLSASMGLPGRAPYAASKAGVVGLTHTLGAEWAGRGVRVNAVIPGPVRTPMVVDAIARGVLDEQEIAERTPAGRLAMPEDIAGAVVLLCLPGAGFITAQTVAVDGGYTKYASAHGTSEIVARVAGASRKDDH
jgi:NAD(P)-dependent dehydrogenase (short-subunit alcohol dehydrogenase family)